jgi:hypothetical protein
MVLPADGFEPNAAAPSAADEPQEYAYQPAAPIDCCVLLRAKSMYYRTDERPGRLHPSDAMHYWCLKTHTQVGPDEQATHPRVCQGGRRCFQQDES